MSFRPEVAARARELGGAILDLVLPRACPVCERPLERGDRRTVCGRCWSRVRWLAPPRCERCGHPLPRSGCRWCAALPPFVRAGRSAASLDGGTAGEIVHALKYGGWSAIARDMAEPMARSTWPEDVVMERAALIPVPLARARERERGYNQSALLAAELARRWGVPVWSECIVRSRATRTQTRLTPEQRRGNVAGAFRAVPTARPRLRGAHLVLVDDVVTTGATIRECAEALYRAGARIISFVTFGRAPLPGDLV